MTSLHGILVGGGLSSARATRIASDPSSDAIVAPVRLISGQKPDTENRRASAARPPLMRVPASTMEMALFAASADKDLALAVLRAYNDWHIDEWAGTYPGRIIPMALPVLWDAEECAREVRRVARKGCHSLTFTENPATVGYPSFHSDHWDPLWRAVCEENVVVSIHPGSSGKLSMTAADAPST